MTTAIPATHRDIPPVLDVGALHDRMLAVAARYPFSDEELGNPDNQQTVRNALQRDISELATLVAEAQQHLHTHAAIVFRGFPVSSNVALIGLLSLFGLPTSNGNGRPHEQLVYEVSPDDAATGPANLSKGRAAQLPHTDSPVRENPHAFLALACVVGDPDGGGLSTIVHVDDIVAALDAQDGGETTRLLQDPIFPYLDAPLYLDEAPVLAAVLTKQSDGRWDARFRDDVLLAGFERHPQHADAAHRSAVDSFISVLGRAELTATFRLTPGDVLLADNTRVLHGRTEITGDQPRQVKRIKLDGMTTAPSPVSERGGQPRHLAAALRLGERFNMPPIRPVEGVATSCLPEVGRLLAALSAAASTHDGATVVEFGSGGGVGTAWLLHGLSPQGRLVTVEQNAEQATAVRELFADDPRVTVLQADWHDVAPQLENVYLLFADAGLRAELHPSGWDATVDIVEVGGTIILDDLTPPGGPALLHNEAHKRRFAFEHPRLHGAEVAVTAESSVLVAVRGA